MADESLLDTIRIAMNAGIVWRTERTLIEGRPPSDDRVQEVINSSIDGRLKAHRNHPGAVDLERDERTGTWMLAPPPRT